jgi:LysM repeat protein
MAEKVKAKSGDTLSGIAKAQGTTVAQILADNPTLAARQAAGQTVLFSGTTVKITAPQQATNPYAAATSGPAAGAGTNVGTASVPFNAAADALRKLTGGQTLTDAEKTILGMGNTGAATTDTTGITPDGSGDTPPAGVTEVSRVDNKDGTFTVTYSDGTTKIIGTKTPTGKKIVRQYYSGSGAARVQITEYDDGTKDTVPAPEQAAGLGADDVNKLIQAAIANQNAEFQKMLAAQQKQLETAKAEQVAAQRKSAFDVIKERFTQMGIKEVGDDIAAIFAGKGVDRFNKPFDEIPTTSEGFYLQLINTKSYYERFGKVNEARLNAGYKALDEKTIVGMEDEYQKVLTSYNMPTGFYDQTTDFQSFLKNNLTNVDVANIIQAYRDFVTTGTDSNVRKQLKDLYGIGDEALTAYMIDPTKGQGILEQIAGKNMNTAAALIEGLTAEQAQMAQAYGAGSLGYGSQRQKYSQVQQELQTTGNLAAIYGENFGAKEAIAAEFGGDVQAQAQAARIKATGQAAFGGTSGLGSKALRTRTV